MGPHCRAETWGVCRRVCAELLSGALCPLRKTANAATIVPTTNKHTHLCHYTLKDLTLSFDKKKKTSTIQFYHLRLASQMPWWKPASSGRQRKHPADLPPQPVFLNASPLSCHLKKTSFKLNAPPFYFLWVCLSLLLTPSYSLCFFFFFWFCFNNPMFASSQRVACSATWPMVDLI